MTTENDEVHGTVIHSGYHSDPEADPAMDPAEQASDEEPNGGAEDDERYMTTADSATADGATADDAALADSTGDDDDAPADRLAGSSDAPDPLSATSVDDTADSEDSTDDEDNVDDEDNADEEDEDEIIVLDSADGAAEDGSTGVYGDETGEAADLEAMDEPSLAPGAVGGQAAAAAVTPPPAGAPAHARTPADSEFAGDAGLAGDPGEIRQRWAAIQSSFVDDPRTSVADAATFLGEVMTTLMANAGEREHELRGEWDRDDLDTEDLRKILRRYRGFLDRLAAL
jgi:hypothetical protein